jgi:carbamoyl-phosphate synthase large subunit
VAPQLTLSDRDYQAMRDEAGKIINEVGLQTGGANIQFAVHPKTGERVVIEMNPRVSRSSALASKATGFPIAKIAALLAIGYQLEEIQNDITKTTPSCYEPALDYVVTKIPRFAFEKFAGAKDLLSTQMKSVGEVMGIGRTFQESLMKAVLSLERHGEGFPEITVEDEKISYPNSQRLYHIYQAFREGWTLEAMHELTQITPWFLEQVKALVDFEGILKKSSLSMELIYQAKKRGFSDALIARLMKKTELQIREFRQKENIHPSFQQVDTCAGEFPSSTPYYYSTYWSKPAELPRAEKRVAVLGSGPNRIGQGIEFDYSCVRGVKGFQKKGWQVCMINSNPETVSTDYDTADLLFFEPLTEEHVSEILKAARVESVVVQLGGQTPIHCAPGLVKRGFKIMGSDLEAIDLAEDRGRFNQICRELNFKIPESGMSQNLKEAELIVERIGYPLICRPSYVLGGRRMEVVENHEELISYFDRHQEAISSTRPCLIDQFLEGALEVDVDLVRGSDWVVVGGVVEHIEAAGVHSGDSQGVIPPQRLRREISDKVEKLSKELADRIGVIGHLNLQLAIKKDMIYMLEANPRSSRSVPFVVKATGIPLIDLGVSAMLGETDSKVNSKRYVWRERPGVSVKGVVFPFKKFPEADSILGPEMKSTGESMGRGNDYGEALMKGMLSSHMRFPEKGEVFFSLREKDKEEMLLIAKDLLSMGYTLSATKGTAQYFKSQGLECAEYKKVHEGRPHCVDKIRSGGVSIVINTTSGRQSIEASFNIRRACIDYSIPCLTESDAAEAFLIALKKTREKAFDVNSLPPMLK